MAKVLIVDDETPIRRTLKEILEFEKFKVEEASDGLECLVQLKKNQYDVILMDIKMPKMDGMEALERIQTLAPDTPVVMISGHANIDTAVEAVKKGAFDFISKPPDLNRLLITDVEAYVEWNEMAADATGLRIRSERSRSSS